MWEGAANQLPDFLKVPAQAGKLQYNEIFDVAGYNRFKHTQVFRADIVGSVITPIAKELRIFKAMFFCILQESSHLCIGILGIRIIVVMSQTAI